MCWKDSVDGKAYTDDTAQRLHVTDEKIEAHGEAICPKTQRKPATNAGRQLHPHGSVHCCDIQMGFFQAPQ